MSVNYVIGTRVKAVTDFHPVGVRDYSNVRYSKLVKGQIGLVQKFSANSQKVLLRVSWNLNPQEEQVYLGWEGIPKEVVYCCQLAEDTDSLLIQEQDPLAKTLPNNSYSKHGLPGVERPTSTSLPSVSTFSSNATTSLLPQRTAAEFSFGGSESKPSFGTPTANYILSPTASKPSFGAQVTKSTLEGTAANFCVSGASSKPIFGKKFI